MKIEIKLEDGRVLKGDYDKYEDIPDEMKEALTESAERYIKGEKDIFGHETLFNNLFGFMGKEQSTVVNDIITVDKTKSKITNTTIIKPNEKLEVPDNSIPFRKLSKQERNIRILSDIANDNTKLKLFHNNHVCTRRGHNGRYIEFVVIAKNESRDSYRFSMSVLELNKKHGKEIIVLNVVQSDEYLDDCIYYGKSLLEFCNESDWALGILANKINSKELK